jgi:hypothetical protein
MELHVLKCRQNPNKSVSGRCDFCKKQFKNVKLHEYHCALHPHNIAEKKSNRVWRYAKVPFTVQIDRVKHERITNGRDCMTDAIIEAVTKKFERDGPTESKDYRMCSLSMPKGLLSVLRALVWRTEYLSVGHYIRTAVDEELEERDNENI